MAGLRSRFFIPGSSFFVPRPSNLGHALVTYLAQNVQGADHAHQNAGFVLVAEGLLYAWLGQLRIANAMRRVNGAWQETDTFRRGLQNRAVLRTAAKREVYSRIRRILPTFTGVPRSALAIAAKQSARLPRLLLAQCGCEGSPSFQSPCSHPAGRTGCRRQRRALPGRRHTQ
jgi:hypothetical protein